MRLKDISEQNRPRERLQQQGISALSDAEVLALILKMGNKEENVVDMSNRLISKYGLAQLSSCSLQQLQEIKGIGPAKAAQVLALFELARRQSFRQREDAPVQSAKDVFEILAPRLSALEKEHFFILHLDTKQRILKQEIISVGILNATLVHPREVFQAAIKENSKSIIVAHNHPSGDPAPSTDDEKVTKVLFRAGELLNIAVLDHVIVGKNNFYSFREEGKL